jgi:hypothetical protein
LHEFFELAALQRRFVHAGFDHAQARAGIARQFFGLARKGTGFDRLGARIGRLARQLLLDAAELLPQQHTADQGGDRQGRSRNQQIDL